MDVEKWQVLINNMRRWVIVKQLSFDFLLLNNCYKLLYIYIYIYMVAFWLLEIAIRGVVYCYFIVVFE